jgi:cytochrome c biogenesis protein CcmG, thiol:disulfide interchange protein DsbE
VRRFVFVVLLCISSAPFSSGQSALPALGSAAPDFKLHSPTLNGAVQLAALKGKPVVLNFWGSWCAPCRDEMPAFNTIAGQLRDKFTLLAIAVDEKPEVSLKYLSDNKFSNLTLLTDPPSALSNDLETANAVAAKYGANTYPTTVFIDAKGVVQAVRTSPMTERTFKSYLRNIDVTPSP